MKSDSYSETIYTMCKYANDNWIHHRGPHEYAQSMPNYPQFGINVQNIKFIIDTYYK